MLKFIKQCIKDTGYFMSAETKNIESHMNYFLCLYKTKQGEYKKFEGFYNKTDVYTLSKKHEMNLIGVFSEETFENKIHKYIESYDSFDECRKHIIIPPVQYKVDRFLEGYMKAVVQSVYNIQIDGVSIIDVDIILNPTGLISVSFIIDNTLYKPLKGFIGEPINVSSYRGKHLMLVMEFNKILLASDVINKI